MHAITYTEFGPAADVLTLSDLPTPTPAPGEVLVRLKYSGVNPSDAKARAGGRPGVTKPPFPQIIPHSDGSGVIEAVGDGVDSARIGEQVWIWNGQWGRAAGTAAKYIALPSAQAVTLPNGVDLKTGATLGIPGLTAAAAVLGDGPVAGQTLLISGGAGAVGHNAVQLAKWAGANVISTASPSGFEYVKTAGADHVFDYKDPELSQKIIDVGGPVDRAIEVEFGANAPVLADVLKDNGKVVAYGSQQNMSPSLPFGPYLFKAITIDVLLVYILPDKARAQAINYLHDALAAGALNPSIHAEYDLSDCAIAHHTVMQPGRQGAVLLNLSN